MDMNKADDPQKTPKSPSSTLKHSTNAGTQSQTQGTSQQADRAIDDAVATSAAEKAREPVEAAAERFDAFTGDAGRIISETPWGTTAVVFGVGLLVGLVLAIAITRD